MPELKNSNRPTEAAGPPRLGRILRRCACAVTVAVASSGGLCLAQPAEAPAAGSPAAESPFAEASADHRATPRNDPNSRKAHEQLLEKLTKGQIDVYFEGDSITRRWGGTDYPNFLAMFQKDFHGWNAANFAWGGDNTHNILWRKRNGELDGVNPKVFVLQAGTNNLPGRGPVNERAVNDVVEGNKAIMAEFMKHAPDAKIIVFGVFERPQNPAAADGIKEINKQLAALADGDKIRFVDINDKLVDENGQGKPDVFADGLHLKEKGYEIWAAALKPVLTEILGPPAEEDNAPPPTGDPSASR